jgi:hypothetical protein
MEISTMAYPWDVARLGPGTVLDELSAVGVDRIAVAATYHPIDTFSPRTRERLYSVSAGAVLFGPRPGRYGRITPPPYADPAPAGAWSELPEAAAQRGIALDAWVIGLFQPWIARDFPDCARVLATGEPLSSGACPAAPDVQDYLEALLVDLVDRAAPRTIRLEGVGFRGFDHGWTRPRILHPLNAAAEWLLRLCFCPTCTGRARARGIDVDGLRGRVLDRLDQALGHLGSPRTTIDAWIAQDEELAGFVADRADVVLGLIRRLVSSVPVEIVLTMLLDDSDLPGEPTLDALLDTAAGVMVVLPERAELGRRARRLADRGGDAKRVVGLVIPVGAGRDRASHFDTSVAAGVELPVDELALYNFGLLDPTEFAAVVASGRSLRRRVT